MKKYCTQNNGDCTTCSLVNYGMDCHNNKIVDDVSEERRVADVFGGDYIKPNTHQDSNRVNLSDPKYEGAEYEGEPIDHSIMREVSHD